MKNVYESFRITRNPPLLNYWKRIIVSTHKRNARFLAIEIFKFKGGLDPPICKEMILQNRQTGTNCEIISILIY